MDELQTVNQIVGEAVKDSSYVTVLISSGVFIAYTLIIRLVDLFKAKDRNKPIVQMAQAIQQVSENVVKLNQVLDKTFQDADSKEKAKLKNVIEIAFDSFRVAIERHCIDVIIHNNVDKNKELIKENLFKLISTEYYRLYNILSAYEIDSINVSTKLKEDWIDDLTKECLNIVYNGQEPVVRIGQIGSKLSIIFDEHSVYVSNKVFN